MSELHHLVKQLVKLLETVEESDNGKEFHPTVIRTCRLQHGTELERIMPQVTKLVSYEVT